MKILKLLRVIGIAWRAAGPCGLDHNFTLCTAQTQWKLTVFRQLASPEYEYRLPWFKRSNAFLRKHWAVAYAENFHGGGLVQGHMVVICIWCALFVTSQFDVISMFPNQRFGDVCWHNMHIFLHPLPLFYVSLRWIFNLIYLFMSRHEVHSMNTHTLQNAGW